MSDLFLAAKIFIGRITIRLQITFEVFQYPIGSSDTSPRLIIKQYGFVYRIVINPIISPMAFTFFCGVSNFYCAFISLDITLGYGFSYKFSLKNIEQLKALSVAPFPGRSGTRV